MRPTRLVVLLAVCVGVGCSQLVPPIPSDSPPSQEPSESLDELVRTINDKPDVLHSDHTPAGDRLIKFGTPAIPRMLDLMLSDDESTRLRAQRVLEGITLEKHGFVFGRGWPSGDSHKEDARFRAFWKSLGDLDWQASRTDRERAVKLWREWVANGQPLPPNE
jgi:hypothetical protein